MSNTSINKKAIFCCLQAASSGFEKKKMPKRLEVLVKKDISVVVLALLRNQSKGIL